MKVEIRRDFFQFNRWNTGALLTASSHKLTNAMSTSEAKKTQNGSQR